MATATSYDSGVTLRAPKFFWTDAEIEAGVIPKKTPETSVLDFKCDLDGWPPGNQAKPDKRKAQMEFARDVAQFANTSGGCLVIGVDELEVDGVVVANDVCGVPEADNRREWMTEAMKNCVFPPTIPCLIEPLRHSGRLVLAVNVPASAHLVGVWDGNSKIEYPYRTDHGKKYMNPDDAERYRMNTTRSAKIALVRAVQAAAPQGGSVPVALELSPAVMFDPGSSIGPPQVHSCRTVLDPEKLDEEEFTIEILTGNDVRGGDEVRVPYALVRAAWVAGHGGIGLFLHARIVKRGARCMLDAI